VSITLDDTQKIQIQTHVDLIQKAYAKVQAQQYATNELEKDFQGFINQIIVDNDGDPNKQYTYNLETGTLEETEEAPTAPPAGLDGAGAITPVSIPDDPKVGDSFDV
jgi:hypothetical protein